MRSLSCFYFQIQRINTTCGLFQLVLCPFALGVYSFNLVCRIKLFKMECFHIVFK